jgi:hypothetical protein
MVTSSPFFLLRRPSHSCFTRSQPIHWRWHAPPTLCVASAGFGDGGALRASNTDDSHLAARRPPAAAHARTRPGWEGRTSLDIGGVLFVGWNGPLKLAC